MPFALMVIPKLAPLSPDGTAGDFHVASVQVLSGAKFGLWSCKTRCRRSPPAGILPVIS